MYYFVIHCSVYTCSEPRWHIPTLPGSPRPACPEHLGDLIGKIPVPPEKVASHTRLVLQPGPAKTTSVLSFVQPTCFLTLTDSPARRLIPNDFLFNHFRTLSTATEGMPHSSLFLSSLPHNVPTILFPNFFSCNTYGSPRKCCKQRTYGIAKPFRCNTYKKHVGG